MKSSQLYLLTRSSLWDKNCLTTLVITMSLLAKKLFIMSAMLWLVISNQLSVPRV